MMMIGFKDYQEYHYKFTHNNDKKITYKLFEKFIPKYI